MNSFFQTCPARRHFGLRWQSAAATPLSNAQQPHDFGSSIAYQSGVAAIALPPQSIWSTEKYGPNFDSTEIIETP